jgi:hypothetical protein
VTVETLPGGALCIRDRFVFLRRALLVLAALFAGLTAVLAAEGDRSRSVLGPLAGALACVALAAVVEDSDFECDAAAREVRWTKQRLFGGRRGTIAFDAIQEVFLEIRSERSDSGLSRSRDARVFLRTREGALAMGSSNLDVKTARDAVALPLLTLLGRSPSALVERGPGTRL